MCEISRRLCGRSQSRDHKEPERICLFWENQQVRKMYADRRANGRAMRKRYDADIVPAESIAARADVASQLKNARVSLGITQQVLADRAGTQKSNISRMESGNYNPTLDFIVKVAASMGKEVNILIS